MLVKLFAQGASVNAVVFSFFRDLGCFPVLLTAAVSIKLKPIDTCGRVGVVCGRVREALVPRHTVLAGGTERRFQLCIYSCKCAWRSLVKLDPSKGMENNNSERAVSRAYTCIYVVNMKRSPSTPSTPPYPARNNGPNDTGRLLGLLRGMVFATVATGAAAVHLSSHRTRAYALRHAWADRNDGGAACVHPGYVVADAVVHGGLIVDCC